MSTTDWLDLSQSSNYFKQSYLAGFLDQSGSDTIVRSGNFSMSGLNQGSGYINQSLTPTLGSNAGNIYLTWKEMDILYVNKTSLDIAFPINATIGGNLLVGGDASFTQGLVSLSDVSFRNRIAVGSYTVIGDQLVVASSLTTARRLFNQLDASLSNSLFIRDDLSLNGRLFIGSDASLGGRLLVASDLSSNGQMFIGGDASLGGQLFVASDLSSNGRLFVGRDASLANQLFVNLDLSLNGNFYNIRDTVLTNKLFVPRDVSVNSRIFTVGDASLSGRLFVASDLSINSRFFAGGDASLGGRLFVASDLSVNGRFFGAGDASLGGQLFVKSDVSANQRLFVANDSILTTRLSILKNSDLTVSNRIFIVGDASFPVGKLFVGSDSSVYRVSVGLDTSLNRQLSIVNDAKINGRLFNLIDASFGSRLTIGSDLSANGRLFAGGDASLNGRLFVPNVLTTSRNGRLFSTNINDIKFLSRSFVGGDVTANARLFLVGDASFGNNLYVTNDVTASTRLFVQLDMSSNARTIVGGDVSANARLFVVGDVSLNNRLFVAGDLFLNSRLGVNNDVSASRIFVGSDASLAKRLFIRSDLTTSSRLFTAVGSDITLPTLLFTASDVTANARLFTIGDASFGNNLYITNDATLSGANGSGFRYYKLEFISTQAADGALQFAEWYFYNNGTYVPCPTLAQEATNYQTNFGTNPSPGQTISCGFNNISTDKFCLLKPGSVTTALLNPVGYVIIDFGTPTIINSYTWATAGDETNRDPITWNLYGSNNYSFISSTGDWRTLHSVVNFSPTAARNTLVGTTWYIAMGNLFVGNNMSSNARAIVGGDVSANARLFVGGDASLGGRLFVSSHLSTDTRLFVRGDASFNSKNALIISNNVTTNGKLLVGNDVSLNGELYVAKYSAIGVGARLAIGATKAANTYALDISSSNTSNNPYPGAVRIWEATGTYPTASGGTLVLQHGDVSGVSSVVFPSTTNFGKDYASIAYYESISGGILATTAGKQFNYNYYGDASSTSSSALVINVQSNPYGNVQLQDSLILQPTGSCIIDACANNTVGQTLIQPRGGNVSIGKINPLYALDVSGRIGLLGNIVSSSFNVYPIAQNLAASAVVNSEVTASAISTGGSRCNGPSFLAMYGTNAVRFQAGDGVNSIPAASFYSTNSGATWTSISTLTTVSYNFAMYGNNAIAVPTSSGTLSYSIYYSSNGGSTWTASNLSTTFNGTTYLVMYGTNALISTGNASPANYYSSNGGATWTSILTSPAIKFTFAMYNNNAIAVPTSSGTTSYSTYYSSNGGATWTASNLSTAFNGSSSLAMYGTNAVLSSAGNASPAFYYSSNSGATWTSVSNITTTTYASGLTWKRFTDYHNESPTYDSTATLTNTSSVGVTDFTNVSTATSAVQGVNASDNYSIFWYGYLLSDFTGTWTFGLTSDDGSYMWIGDAAYNYTTANANINNGGAHGMSLVTTTISLVSGVYYPIRIMFGEMGGGDDIKIFWNRNGSGNNANFSGKFFNALAIKFTVAIYDNNAIAVPTSSGTTSYSTYYSSNGGATWTASNLSTAFDGSSYLAMYGTNAVLSSAGNASPAFYYSSNSGATWTSVSNITTLAKTFTVAIYGNNAIAVPSGTGTFNVNMFRLPFTTLTSSWSITPSTSYTIYNQSLLLAMKVSGSNSTVGNVTYYLAYNNNSLNTIFTTRAYHSRSNFSMSTTTFYVWNNAPIGTTITNWIVTAIGTTTVNDFLDLVLVALPI